MRTTIRSLRFSILLYCLFFITVLHATGMTVESLKKINIDPMKDTEIKQLIIGNILVVRNTETLAHFAARFDPNNEKRS